MHSQNETIAGLMVYGVTVTLLILVQSFKVRILVDQQEKALRNQGFFVIYRFFEFREVKNQVKNGIKSKICEIAELSK